MAYYEICEKLRSGEMTEYWDEEGKEGFKIVLYIGNFSIRMSKSDFSEIFNPGARSPMQLEETSGLDTITSILSNTKFKWRNIMALEVRFIFQMVESLKMKLIWVGIESGCQI